MLLFGPVKFCNETEKLGLVSVNSHVKSLNVTASGKCIFSWWINVMLIVKYMSLSTLPAEGHEDKD